MEFVYFHTEKIPEEDILTCSLTKYGRDFPYFHVHELVFSFRLKTSPFTDCLMVFQSYTRENNMKWIAGGEENLNGISDFFFLKPLKSTGNKWCLK